MSNIVGVEFKTGEKTTLADDILDEAKKNYQSVLIVGWDNDGFLDVRSTTNLDQKDCLYLIHKLSHKILNGDYAPE